MFLFIAFALPFALPRPFRYQCLPIRLHCVFNVLMNFLDVNTGCIPVHCASGLASPA